MQERVEAREGGGGSNWSCSNLGPVRLRWAHFGQTVAKLGPFTLLQHPFHSPILELKRNGRLYVKTKWAQRNRTGP